ncbi:MAG: tyrosine-protein phosphatase [Ilumatobacteraceae bacterium]
MIDAVVPQRHIEFEGSTNFRDLGGYPSTLGGTTRWGRVYRADGLHALTVDDLERFASLGIVTVYDLRTDDERAESPDAVPSIHVSVMGRLLATRDTPDFAALVGHDDGVTFMRDMCVGLLEHAAPEIGRVLTGLSTDEHLPGVFHCTAGKDRTGVIAALLLEWLGVDRETVVDDFHLTERYHHVTPDHHAFQRMLRRGVGPEAAAGALGAPRSMMADTLRELDERFGGVEAFLTGPAAMERPHLERLRELLIDDDS